MGKFSGAEMNGKYYILKARTISVQTSNGETGVDTVFWEIVVRSDTCDTCDTCDTYVLTYVGSSKSGPGCVKALRIEFESPTKIHFISKGLTCEVETCGEYTFVKSENSRILRPGKIMKDSSFQDEDDEDDEDDAEFWTRIFEDEDFVKLEMTDFASVDEEKYNTNPPNFFQRLRLRVN